MKKRLLIVISLFISCASIAQNPSNFLYSRLGIEDGLPTRHVNDIVQDSLGFYWVGTDEGLYRFDGSEFIEANKCLSNEQVLNAAVSSLQIYKGYTLWIASTAGTFSVNLQTKKSERYLFANTDFQPFNTPPIITEFIVVNDSTSLGLSTTGSVFKYTYNQGVKKIFDYQNTLPKYKNIICFDFHFLNNYLWIATNNGLLKLQLINNEFALTNHFYKGIHFRSITVLNDVMYFATPTRKQVVLNLNSGIFHSVKIVNTNTSVYDIINHSHPVTSIALDSNLIMFGAFKGGLIWDLKNDKWINFDKILSKKIGSRKIKKIYRDNYNQFWLISGDGLLKIDIRNAFFSKFLQADKENPTVFSVRKIFEWKPDQYLIGNYAEGATYLNIKTGEKFPLQILGLDVQKKKINKAVIYEMFKDSSETLWMSKETFGLYKVGDVNLKNKTIRYNLHEFKNSYSIEPRCFIQYDKNRLLIGGKKKLSLFNLKTNTIKSISFAPYDFPVNGINNMVVTDTCIWLATHNGLYSMSKNTHDISYKPIRNAVHDMIALSNDSLILATNNGIVLYSIGNNTFDRKTKKNGLSHNIVYSITKDPFISTRFWMGTDFGLSSYNSSTNTFKNYTTLHGLPDNEFNYKANTITSSNKIFLGTVNGLSLFNVFDITYTTPVEKLRISEWQSLQDNKELITKYEEPFNNEIQLSEENKFFSFRFTLNNYFENCSPVYQYKLEGYEKAWQESGREGFCKYTQLPKGEYYLKFRAQHCNGTWIEKENPLKITVYRSFYKTWWFIVLVFIGISFLGYFMTSFVYKQKLKVQRLRTKIASDLHDEVGGVLTSIAVNSAVQEQLSDNKDQQKIFHQINSLSKQATSIISDVVWAVDYRNDSLEALLNRLQEFANQILEPQGKRFIVDVLFNYNDLKLNLLQRQQLFLIGKEAIHNTAKHSNASVFYVNISRAGKKSLQVSFSDNGTLFNSEARLTGQGLKNMEMRAKKMNAVFNINANKGVVISLQIKL